jgi:HPt (histidine-containing phosphotransfer) domain-containing protein
MELSAETTIEPAVLDAGGTTLPVIDRGHLRHQTLGDGALERVVLGLFLDEAPRYAQDISSANDSKSWRMAVHTLKGVALNLGAFRLAHCCREHERHELKFDLFETQAAARDIVAAINLTTAAILEILMPAQRL